ALRSEAYYYAFLIIRGMIFPLDFRGQREVYPVYKFTPIKGITSWIMPWNEGNEQRLAFFPMAGTSYNTTTLTADINTTDTTIPVTSTGSFIKTGGRITIGSEKILYQYSDATNFYGCERGVEGTTA